MGEARKRRAPIPVSTRALDRERLRVHVEAVDDADQIVVAGFVRLSVRDDPAFTSLADGAAAR